MCWNIGPKGLNVLSVGLFQKLHSIRLAMPHRMCGLHYCFDDKSLRPFLAGFRYFFDKHVRERFRVHYGDEKKVSFQLQTYGIPYNDDSPMKVVNGQLNVKWHSQWLQIRQAQEGASPDAKESITIPHRFDVLFGRSKIAKKHTGNLRAAHLVSMWQTKYDEAGGRYAKTAISYELIEIIKDSGGKFLKSEDSGWVEVEDDVAREKISHWCK